MVSIDFIIGTAAGFVSAVIASMGMGGGSVLIIYLTLMLELSQRQAQGINLLFFLPIGAVSLYLHNKAGRIDTRAAKQFLPMGVLGVLLGSVAAQFIGGELLSRGFALFLAGIGLRQLFPGAGGQKQPPDTGAQNESTNNGV